MILAQTIIEIPLPEVVVRVLAGLLSVALLIYIIHERRMKRKFTEEELKRQEQEKEKKNE